MKTTPKAKRPCRAKQSSRSAGRKAATTASAKKLHVMAKASPPTGAVNARKQSRRTAKGALGAFDPTLPENGALIIAGVLRDQFNALDADIQTRATEADVNADVAALEADIAQRTTQDAVNAAMDAAVTTAVNTVLPQTSANTNSVAPLAGYAPDYYVPSQMQEVMNKIDELIAVLRR